MEKLLLAQSIALHACQADRVLYVSWEHTARSLVRRMICSRAELDTMAVRRGRFDASKLVRAGQDLQGRRETPPSRSISYGATSPGDQPPKLEPSER